MGNQSPSRFRRLGREAFEPMTDPMEVQPFKKGSWGYKFHLPHWIEGWLQAKAQYEQDVEDDVPCKCIICPHCGGRIINEE